MESQEFKENSAKTAFRRLHGAGGILDLHDPAGRDLPAALDKYGKEAAAGNELPTGGPPLPFPMRKGSA